MLIGRYKIVGTLGSGGMSQVSLARSTRTGELVVLKRQHHPDEDAALLDEARVGVRLTHPSIVETLDLFEHEGRPVLVVAYAPGATLADLRVAGPLPVELICRIGYQIADALECIHTATEEDGTPLNMLHRDVTPSNIIVGYDGTARLIDLGIARSVLRQSENTQDGILKGTLRYLAPELLDTGFHSRLTDLWGLGMTLWESALGRYALEGHDHVIFANIVGGRSMQLRPGENMDPRLRHAIGQLLATAPECRPPSAADAAAVFRQYLSQFDDESIAEAARSFVRRVAGPEPKLGTGANSYEAMQVVNRAAATYGSPQGDWRVLDEPTVDVDTAGRGFEEATETFPRGAVKAPADDFANIPPTEVLPRPGLGTPAEAPLVELEQRDKTPSYGQEIPKPLDFLDEAPLPAEFDDEDAAGFEDPEGTEVLEHARRRVQMTEQEWLIGPTVAEDSDLPSKKTG